MANLSWTNKNKETKCIIDVKKMRKQFLRVLILTYLFIYIKLVSIDFCQSGKIIGLEVEERETKAKGV